MLLRSKDHDMLKCPLRQMASDEFDRCLFWPKVGRIKAGEWCSPSLCPVPIGVVTPGVIREKPSIMGFPVVVDESAEKGTVKMRATVDASGNPW